MIQQKLLIDRYINLTVPVPPVPVVAGAFVTVPPNSFYLQESSGIFKKTSMVAAAAGPKAHRNFRWLPWLPGAISEIAMNGVDVLTGPMSGCDLVMYRRAGVVYAGHLGTDVGRDDANDAVKLTWNNFANAHPADVVGGFNPARAWTAPIPGKKSGDGAPRFYGLYTTAGQFFTVFAYQQNAGGNATSPVVRIAGVIPVASFGLVHLQAL